MAGVMGRRACADTCGVDPRRHRGGRTANAALSRRLAAAVAALGLCLALAPAAGALTPQQAVALLNHQRAVNGIPGNIVEVSSIDAACQNELTYGSTHDYAVDPSINALQGLSDLWGAGWLNVTNIQPWQWSMTTNPWSWLPEEKWLMDPHTQLLGYADEAGPGQQWIAGELWACVATGGRAISGPTRFYSVPGNGTSRVPTEATMWSNVPGIAPGSTTGPAIVYWLTGDQAGIDRSVTVSGPQGPVALAAPAGSGFAIPTAPLQPHTTYSVAVSWQLQTPNDPPAAASGPMLTQSFSFTTGVAGDASAQDPPGQPASAPKVRRHHKVHGRATKHRGTKRHSKRG